MATPAPRSPFSRRGLLRTSAAGAVAGAAAVAGQVPASARTASRTDVAVAATVVRASHAPAADGSIRLGIRTSVRSGDQVEDGRVVVLDGVDFFASQDEIRETIVTRVRAEVLQRFERRGTAVTADQVTVRVFGGLW